MGDEIFLDFSFFTHRFLMKNLQKFISQLGNQLGVYGTNYKVIQFKHLLLITGDKYDFCATARGVLHDAWRAQSSI